MTIRGCAALCICSLSIVAPQSTGSGLGSDAIRANVESLADIINREYLDPDVAAQVASALRQSLADGRYQRLTRIDALARLLSEDLFRLTHDKHLVVQPAASGEASRASETEMRALAVQRTNGGVRRAEILPGNVGYLELTNFWRLGEAQAAIASAMRRLARADALIVDLRANDGGSPETVVLLVSHFFDAPAGLPLFEIVHRPPEPSDRYTTVHVDESNGRRPMYVLTSAQTFSAGEGLAFLLQERRRAEVVGETTAGAANPGSPVRVSDILSVTVPNGRVKSPVRGGNWEGTGVVPDVPAEASRALTTAHIRALRTLIERAESGKRRDRLERTLKNLKATPDKNEPD